VAFVAFVLIVNCTGGTSCNGTDRRSRAATDNSADRRSAGCANANSRDGSAHTVTSMVTAVVGNGCRGRALSLRVIDSRLNIGPVSLRTRNYGQKAGDSEDGY
jgi:hypothetical protein